MHPKYAVNHAIEDNDMEQAPMLTAAAALALTRSEGINLLPWREERRSQADAKFRQIFVSVVGLAVLVMMLIFLVQFIIGSINNKQSMMRLKHASAPWTIRSIKCSSSKNS